MLQEHYEAVMRRTLERNQRVEQRQKRWSWGGLSTDSDGRTGRGPFFTLKVHPLLSAFLFNLIFIIHLAWCIKEPVRMHQKLLTSSKQDVKVATTWSCFTSAGVKSSHNVHKSNLKLFFFQQLMIILDEKIWGVGNWFCELAKSQHSWLVKVLSSWY